MLPLAFKTKKMDSEASTRKETIDYRLKEAGWDVSDRTQVVKEYYISQQAGSVLREEASSYGFREFSDYVLLERNGKPLAIVEAKKSSKDAEIRKYRGQV